MKNFKNLLFVALLLVSATILGQTKISGTVVDETNQPLPGASVVVKGTKNGTSTDFNGKFTLNAASNSVTVLVSYIGYASKEVSFFVFTVRQFLDVGQICLEIIEKATNRRKPHE